MVLLNTATMKYGENDAVVYYGETQLGVTFSPLDVPGLVYWFGGDSLALADGAAVAAWDDQSGNDNDAAQATAGNRPTLQLDEINGKPVVRFVTDDFLDLDATQPGTSVAIFATVRFNSDTGADQYIYQQSGDTGERLYMFWRASDDVLCAGYYDGGAFRDYTKAWSPVIGTTYVVDFGTGEVNNVLGISGSVDSTPARTNRPVSASRTASIGRDGSTGNGYLTGDILDLLVYGTADISPEDRTLIRNYLANRANATL